MLTALHVDGAVAHDGMKLLSAATREVPLKYGINTFCRGWHKALL